MKLYYKKADGSWITQYELKRRFTSALEFIVSLTKRSFFVGSILCLGKLSSAQKDQMTPNL